MQTEATLEELVSQLSSSSVAFGTDNPVNAALGPALEDALAEANLDPAGMIVLEQTPPELSSDIIDKGMVMSGGAYEVS